jgi:multiple sugar transport system substrate-binding protein
MNTRRITRRGILQATAAAGVAALATAGCQPATPQAVVPTSATAAEQAVPTKAEEGKVKILVQAPANTLDVKKYYEELVRPRFYEKYPNIEVELELAPWGETMEKQKMQLAAGQAADCFLNDNLFTIEYAERGVILELTPYFEQDAAEFKEKIAGWQSGFDVHGKCWAMPRGCHCATTVYNAPLFEKMGLEPPSPDLEWNPEDGGTFLELLMALTVDKNGKHPNESGFDPENIEQWGYISQNYGSVDLWPRTLQNGGRWMDETRTKSRINSPETAGALKFCIDLVHKYHVSPTPEEQAAFTISKTLPAFCAGKVGMVHLLYGHQPGLSEVTDIFNPVAAIIEKGPAGRWSTLFEHHLYIWKESKHPDAAWAWIRNHLLDVEVQVGAVTVSHYQLPVHKDALRDPRLREPQQPPPTDISPWLDIPLNDYGVDFELNAVYVDFWVQLHKSMSYAFEGEWTAEQAIEDAHKECQAILDRRYAKT